MDIVKDKKQLGIPVESIKLNTDDVADITKILTTELAGHGDNRVGLSANQVGLDYRACIVNVNEPLILINPRIISKSKDVVAYHEQCLSIDSSMKKPIQVQRHTEVTITCDNLGELTFRPTTRKWKDSNDFYSDLGMLESVCVQHEIDHLDGKLITDNDRRWFVPIKKELTFNRNDKVMIKLENGTTEFMKFKKANVLLKTNKAELV